MKVNYCIICKEIANGEYEVKVTNNNIKDSIMASLCRGCYLKFLKSHHNEGLFGIYRFKAWLGSKGDMFRL